MKVTLVNEIVSLCDKNWTISGQPVVIELLFKDGSTKFVENSYQTSIQEGTQLCCTSLLEGVDEGRIIVTDSYTQANDKIKLRRNVCVEEKGRAIGVRLWLKLSLKQSFEQFRFFSPPALFDKNDLDEDGFEDYFKTQNLMFREDRFNFPYFMVFDEKINQSIYIQRDPLPSFDSIPERPISRETGEPVTSFLQKTDIGSLGIWNDNNTSLLCACYPFYEAEATVGLFISKTVPFGAFWPIEKTEKFSVGYLFGSKESSNFNDACWTMVKSILSEHSPQAEQLLVSPSELTRYRLEALNKYYLERNKNVDVNEPAGYVLNCHPQSGEQLQNIIQYGFTGQNLLNAYNVLRYGYEYNNHEYRRRAIRIADFFVKHIHIKKSGIFYNLYNIDSKSVSFWWTGLLLPLAYASGSELERLMGPLYKHRKEIIDKLSALEGAYLRCMNEDVTALIWLYRLSKKHDDVHPQWLETAKRYGEFLISVQDKDGGWYRAYSLDGDPILEPVFWFGSTLYEQKSSTGSTIPLLIELWREYGDERFLDSAERAGDFVKDYIIDRVRFNGGVHDSIYSKGQLIDNESILYPMLGMLSLYEATGKRKYLDGAATAAHFCASWVCLWNVPLPTSSTLHKYGFNSIGMGACDTCGAGYIHPFQLMCVAELCKIAILTNDKSLMQIAELYWLGCNQTVELPEKSWGYAFNGLQEEGYLVSWWAVDDPMFSSDTGFGYRLKGEGNKTCFPWITAVAVKAYWSLIDLFNTTDFEEIKKLIQEK